MICKLRSLRMKTRMNLTKREHQNSTKDYIAATCRSFKLGLNFLNETLFSSHTKSAAEIYIYFFVILYTLNNRFTSIMSFELVAVS